MRASTTSDKPSNKTNKTSTDHSYSIDSLEGLTFQQLVGVTRELKDELQHIKLENDIFENFLQSNEPSMIADMNDILERAYAISDRGGTQQSDGSGGDVSRSSYSIQRQSLVTVSKGPRINLTQKTDLALREIEDIQTKYEKFIKKSKKIKFNLRAEIEELGVRASEIDESKKCFEKAVVEVNADATITLKIPAEKFVRYMHEWLKTAVTMLEKLRLRTISSKVMLTKLRAQHALKQELGESVDEVDLEKMEIEKEHMLLEIQQKNKNLIELKRMNGKANLMLVNYKKVLEKQQQQIKSIKKAVEDVQKLTYVLVEEAEQTEHEVAKEQKKVQEIKELIGQYTVPPVMDYIKSKADLNELRKEIKVWKRRITVQNVGLQTYTKLMCQLTGEVKAKRTWFTFAHVNEEAANQITAWEEDEIDVSVEVKDKDTPNPSEIFGGMFK